MVVVCNGIMRGQMNKKNSRPGPSCAVHLLASACIALSETCMNVSAVNLEHAYLLLTIERYQA